MPAVRKTQPTIGRAVLRKHDAQAFVGLKGTAFDEKVKNGDLPKPIKLTDSGKAVGWVTAELEQWLQRRIAKRDGVAS